MDNQNMQNIVLTTHIDMKMLDEVTSKVERLNELLKEARSLVDELASEKIDLSVNVK